VTAMNERRRRGGRKRKEVPEIERRARRDRERTERIERRRRMGPD